MSSLPNASTGGAAMRYLATTSEAAGATNARLVEAMPPPSTPLLSANGPSKRCGRASAYTGEDARKPTWGCSSALSAVTSTLGCADGMLIARSEATCQSASPTARSKAPRSAPTTLRALLTRRRSSPKMSWSGGPVGNTRVPGAFVASERQ